MCHVNVNFLLKIKIIPNLNKDEINQKRNRKTRSTYYYGCKLSLERLD
jgi:hypothetical protein